MSIPEIATFFFATTTAVFLALYWHETSKAQHRSIYDHMQDYDLGQRARADDIQQEFDKRCTELERVVAGMGECRQNNATKSNTCCSSSKSQ